MSIDDGVAWAYGLTNALRLASYAPQIWRVARDRSGAQAISCLSWNLWTAANATTALYAWTRLHDVALCVISAGNAWCCLAVVLITWVKRSRLRTAALAAPLAAARRCAPAALRPCPVRRGAVVSRVRLPGARLANPSPQEPSA